MERQLTVGKDWHQGCEGLASHHTSSCEGAPKEATDQVNERYPQSRPRGGEDERLTGQIMETTMQDLQNMSQDNVCRCGKVLKNNKGLKIHQGRMGCLGIQSETQRTSQLDETEEEPDQDSNHSVRSLHVSSTDEENHITVAEINPRRKRVKWPAGAERVKWKTFEEDVDKTLEAVLAGSVEKKICTFTTII